MGVKGGWGERLKEISEILSTATFTQIPKHNTNNNNKKKVLKLSSVKKLLDRGS